MLAAPGVPGGVSSELRRDSSSELRRDSSSELRRDSSSELRRDPSSLRGSRSFIERAERGVPTDARLARLARLVRG
jgi:hypothetical protein